MKKMIFKCLFVCLMCMPILVMAQENEQGIKFDQSMSWKEVVEKAIRENKHIYMDVMATWCGPCQVMVQNVFTRKEVGDFYNEHFICIKLQTDKTSKDSEYVKAWHKEVDGIRAKANVQALPTSLYFSPQGELVHIVRGAVLDPQRFIQKGKIALDEKRQVYTSLRRFEAGERDVEFLYNLSMDFLELGDMETAREVANVFWQTITPGERLEKKGILYASDFLQSVDDAMFPLFMDHPAEVDAVLGKNVADNKVMRAIEAKHILPLMKDTVNVPNWDGLYQDLCAKYPKKQENIRTMLLNRKLWYGQRYHNNALCVSALKEMLPTCDSEMNKMLIPGYAYELGMKAQSKEDRKIALEWLEKSLDETSVTQLLNYAEVLFLDKQKGKGLKIVNSVLKKGGKEGDLLYDRAMKMKKENAREMKLLKQIVSDMNS